LQKFKARSPAGIALAHYGLVPNPDTILEEAAERLTQWAEVAEQAWKEDRDIAAALESAFAGDLEGVAEVDREKLTTLNGVHSNAAGFRRWLETRDRPHDHP
jgi:hypothetical protein